MSDSFDRNEPAEDQPAYTSRTQKYHSQKNGKKKKKDKNSRYGYTEEYNEPGDTADNSFMVFSGAPDDTPGTDIQDNVQDNNKIPETDVSTEKEAAEKNPLILSDKYKETMDTTPNPLIMKEDRPDDDSVPMSRLDRLKMSGDEVHAELEKKKISKTAKAWLIAVACVAVAVCLLLIFVFEIVSIEGQSMEPTLYGGEKIIVEKVSRYFNFPSKGQIVVTTYDGYDGYYAKRIIALPGEWVEIYDSTVYVNGEALDEPYVNEDAEYDDMELTQVPEGCVFLLGDNREMSLDSRVSTIGCVNADNLIGNAWCVILPFESIRMIE